MVIWSCNSITSSSATTSLVTLLQMLAESHHASRQLKGHLKYTYLLCGTPYLFCDVPYLSYVDFCLAFPAPNADKAGKELQYNHQR